MVGMRSEFLGYLLERKADSPVPPPPPEVEVTLNPALDASGVLQTQSLTWERSGVETLGAPRSA